MISIDGFEIDAMPSVAPEHRIEPTMHPVDVGAEMSDHAIERPMMLNIEGVVSDSPIGEVAERREEGGSPSEEGYAFLVKLMSEKRLVTVSSQVYPDFDGMMLVSLTGPKTAETGESFRFRATFQRMIIANVNIEERATTITVRRAKPKKKKGNQAQAEASEGESVEKKEAAAKKEASKNESLASKLFR